MEWIIGFLIGAAIGATGVGGGVMTAPALILFAGFPARDAIGVALVFSAVTKVGAVIVYLWRRHVCFRALGVMLCGGLPGALLGALLTPRLRSGRAESWMLIAVGAAVAVSASFSLARTFTARSRSAAGPRRLGLLGALSAPVGFEVGFSSAGAGALGSILLFNFASLEPASVVGTDLVFGMVVSAAGGGIHAMAGDGRWDALTRLLPAGIVGAVTGAAMASRLPAKILRCAVLAWAAVLGLMLTGKGLGTVFG